MNDESLLALVMASPSEKDISLRRTSITPAGLAAVFPYLSGLTLGEGNISQADLQMMPHHKMIRLALNDPKFNAQVLAYKNFTFQVLDLRNSGTTNKDFNQFLNNPNLQIDLSHTQVTSQALRQAIFQSVRLEGNQVKVGDLVDVATRMSLYLRSADFTPSQLNELLTTSDVIRIDAYLLD